MVYVYLNGLQSLLFLISITLSVSYIEGAMNRPYAPDDRFIMIMKYYIYKDLSQIAAFSAALMFPSSLVLPIWATYDRKHFWIMLFVTLVGTMVAIWHQLRTTNEAAFWQKRRCSRMSSFVDDMGRLLIAYDEVNTPDRQEDLVTKYNFYRLARHEMGPLTSLSNVYQAILKTFLSKKKKKQGSNKLVVPSS
jgi:hypothetical protein